MIDEKVREKYGIRCGAIGIFLNICLFVFKFIAGTISGSIAITADAFNNLSDAGSSLISLMGFKLSAKKADADHPYGHGRLEYISGLLVAVIIFIMAYELISDSISKIIHPDDIVISPIVFAILIISIVVKIIMFSYNRIIGKKILSPTLMATALDSVSDSIATLTVLIAMIVANIWGIHIDGYSGLVVSLFILWAGYNAAKDTIGPLLGQPPTLEFVEKIESIVLREEHQKAGIIGMHDLIVHDYGPGRLFVSLHAEVPSDGDVMELHDLIDNIEFDLKSELSCHAVIHMDPVCINDPETNMMKQYVINAIDSINESNKDHAITFHDFRMVKGPTHTNLIFDIVVPFDYALTDEELIKSIATKVYNENNRCFCAINVDKAYT